MGGMEPQLWIHFEKGAVHTVQGNASTYLATITPCTKSAVTGQRLNIPTSNQTFTRGGEVRAGN
jgi:hypothetical protein